MNKLTSSEYEFLTEHLLSELNSYDVELYLFGSRAKSNNSKYSDIDLLIKAKDYSKKLKAFISNKIEFFENSNFPYKIEIVFDNELAESYREDIENSLSDISKLIS